MRDALVGSAMLAALASLWLLGRQFACVALRDDDAPAGGPACRPTQGSAAIRIPHEDLLYATVIDTLYKPVQFASVRHPRGILWLQSQTVSGLEDLGYRPVQALVEKALLPDSADEIVREFRRANSTRDGLPYLLEGMTVMPTYLDSSTARSILGSPDSVAKSDPLVSDALAGLPLDSLPGILTLSRAGSNPAGDVALLYATLRTRSSRNPGHMEAAAFIIARRDGWRWNVSAEVPARFPLAPPPRP